MTVGSRKSGLSLLAVAVVLTGLAVTLPTDVFWSLDEGAKLLQLESWLRWGESEREVVYPGGFRDPEGNFYSKARQYPQARAKGGIRTNWPDTFGLLSWPAYRTLGVPGLFVLPLLAGLATALLSGLVARRLEPRSASLTLLTVGLSTPVFFYSLLFWEHTLVTALGLGGLLALLPGERFGVGRTAFGCALLLCAAALRIEMIGFCAATVLGLIWDRRPDSGRRSLLWGGVVAIVGLGVVALFAWTLLGPKEQEFLAGTMRRLTSGAFWTRVPEMGVAVWFSSAESWGPHLPLSLGLGGVLGVGLCFVSRWGAPRLRVTLFVLGGLLVLIPAAVILIRPQHYRIVHGFFLIAPHAILVFLPTFEGSTSPGRQGRFLSFITLCTLVLLTGLLIFGVQGGLEWGPRYLLILYPLAAIVGLPRLIRWPREIPGRAGVFGVAILGLLLGVGFQVRGAIQLRSAKKNLDVLSRAVSDLDCPIVTPRDWLPGSLAVQYLEKEIYILKRPRHFARWLAGPGQEVERFVLLTQRRPKEKRRGLEQLQQMRVAGLFMTRYQRVESSPR